MMRTRVFWLSWAAASLACSTTPADEVRPCSAEARDACLEQTGPPPIDPVVHLGRADSDTFIEITDIVAEGETLFVCTGVRGLSIFDASTDAPRRLVEKVAPGGDLADATFPRCQHVARVPNANIVLISNRGDEVQPRPWVAAFDISDLSSPRHLSTWEPGAGSVEGITASETHVYVATHSRGVAVLGWQGETLTELSREGDERSDAWQVALRDDTLWVADGQAGLRSYDVSDPSTVTLVGETQLDGTSRDLVLEGGRAYVASAGSVGVVDISDPRSPATLAQHPVRGSALAVALSPPDTLVVAEWDAVRGYDVADPAAITQVFSEVVPTDDAFSRVLAVEASASRLYAGEWTGLHQFELTQGRGPDIATAPRLLNFGALAGGEAATRVLVVRNDGTEPLTVYDIAEPDGVAVDSDCITVDPGRSAAVEVTLSASSGSSLQSRLRVCSDDPDAAEVEVPLSANAPGFGVGDRVPPFALQDLTGQTWRSDELLGKVVVLAYFATF